MRVQHFDLIMYGDTLIEAWRGTILGEPNPRVQGCSEIFHSHFGHKYSSLAFGIAGKAEGQQLKDLRALHEPRMGHLSTALSVVLSWLSEDRPSALLNGHIEPSLWLQTLFHLSLVQP